LTALRWDVLGRLDDGTYLKEKMLSSCPLTNGLLGA
jgi:hypothetical protein